MTEQVVVLGSGYAGTGAIQSLEDSLTDDVALTWISDVDHHLVLHESHRCIRDPDVQDHITIPISDVKSSRTTFIQATVEEIDTDTRTIHTASGADIDYDYLLVGIGSQTAFFGIDGLQTHSHTLKSLEDALAIHEDLVGVSTAATQTDPAQVVVGGAGLSGIQVAGEIAAFRDERNAPLEIHLVEGLDEVYPGNDPGLQKALRSLLEARDVTIRTGEFVSEVDESTVYIGGDDELEYDVLVWTGGITGRDAARTATVEKDERNHRLKTGRTFQTSDERVFAVGDAALIDQNGEPAPPTAQAAWDAASVAGENVARAIRGQSLKPWTYMNKGTVISVGDDAVAHDVFLVPFVSTFGGFPARTLKKTIAVRWIRDLTGIRSAFRAWPDM